MSAKKLTRVQQYRARRRREEKRKKQIAVLLLVIIAASIILTVLICTSGAEFKEQSYVVRKGDTLWSLYAEHCDGVKWDQWLHETLSINGMGHDSYIAPGESIILLTTE